MLVVCDFVLPLHGLGKFPGVKTFYIMAIISSMGVGKARKSMGNVTYRTVRGRTIGSQKRAATGSTPATRGDGAVMSRQQALFGMVSMYMQAHASDIDVSFNKSKYGSQRNYFFAVNRKSLFAALSTLATSAMASGYPTLAAVEDAVTAYATSNPTAIYRVKLSGFENVYLTGEWSSDDNPVSGGGTQPLGRGKAYYFQSDSTYEAPAAATAVFQAGAKIVRTEGNVTLEVQGIPAGITASDIKFLTSNGAVVSGLSVTSVVSSVDGKLVYSAPAISESQNVLAVQVGAIYIRLTSAYVNPNPLG